MRTSPDASKPTPAGPCVRDRAASTTAGVRPRPRPWSRSRACRAPSSGSPRSRRRRTDRSRLRHRDVAPGAGEACEPGQTPDAPSGFSTVMSLLYTGRRARRRRRRRAAATSARVPQGLVARSRARPRPRADDDDATAVEVARDQDVADADRSPATEGYDPGSDVSSTRHSRRPSEAPYFSTVIAPGSWRRSAGYRSRRGRSGAPRRRWEFAGDGADPPRRASASRRQASATASSVHTSRDDAISPSGRRIGASSYPPKFGRACGRAGDAMMDARRDGDLSRAGAGADAAAGSWAAGRPLSVRARLEPIPDRHAHPADPQCSPTGPRARSATAPAIFIERDACPARAPRVPQRKCSPMPERVRVRVTVARNANGSSKTSSSPVRGRVESTATGPRGSSARTSVSSAAVRQNWITGVVQRTPRRPRSISDGSRLSDELAGFSISANEPPDVALRVVSCPRRRAGNVVRQQLERGDLGAVHRRVREQAGDVVGRALRRSSTIP